MKARLRAIFRANLINMASSSKQTNSSYNCCAAALCNNRSDNRPDLICHNFPLDENLKKNRDQKMKRGDKKFPRTAHSSAVLNILVRRTPGKALPWSVGNDEASERSGRAKSREC